MVTVGLLIVAALVGSIAVEAFRGTGAVMAHIDHLRDRDVALLETMHALQLRDLETERLVSRYLTQPDADHAQLLAGIVSLLGESRDDRQRLSDLAQVDEGDAVEAVSAAGSRVTEVYSDVLRLAGEGSPGEAVLVFADDGRTAMEAYRGLLDDLVTAQEAEVDAQFDGVRQETDLARLMVAGVLSAVILLLALVGRVNGRQRRQSHQRSVERDAFSADQAMQGRMHSAFEMSLTEDAALATARDAVRQELPGWRAELLMADSSVAHLYRATTTHPDDAEPSCAVATPMDCPAIRRGTALSFDDADAYDACPQLRGRDLSGGTAVCSPVKVMGKAVGILHTIAPTRPDTDHLRRVEAIVQTSGDRVGVLRAFETTRTQAERDPLTGLLNRRSLEDAVGELAAREVPYSVAFCDLDRFKRINDTHGHAAGDRALRQFGRVLGSTFRPDDLIGRWGGEEFVVVLAETSPEEAADAVERVRASLAMTLLTGDTPSFTVSAGITGPADSFETAVANADRALLEAKRSGRDRVVLHDEWSPEGTDDGGATTPASVD
ncbi:diguanylate cyclase [Euzebya rosea]|uniref:diguanylate cyclase n=1 Tax=Euzebya rosea TaxID=2052804 RepID=UPI000D3EB027|nr:diguanylate cyclase [Euzebya rosea]